MGYLLYKYRESGYTAWLIVDVGRYPYESIVAMLRSFFPNGSLLARMDAVVAFEPGVVSDLLAVCIPKRFHGQPSIDGLRDSPRELVVKLIQRWEREQPENWESVAMEIRTRVLQLS